jgi:hypothetical protein
MLTNEYNKNEERYGAKRKGIIVHLAGTLGHAVA